VLGEADANVLEGRRRAGEEFTAGNREGSPRGSGFHRSTSQAPGSAAGMLVGKKVVPMDLSRTQFIKLLRHAGLEDVADAAETTLPAQVDARALDKFCSAYGVSMSMLTDRMGASP
jgi:hypothetical protein